MDKKFLPGDGVITGTGSIMGTVCIYAQDLQLQEGRWDGAHAKKITKIMDPYHEIKNSANRN
ncbi:MAG: carboxyl transferase domain-containing protein [Bacteroidales bacterium]